MMLSAAETAFVASVDRSVLIGAVIALVIAAIVGLLLARYVSGPLKRLEFAVEDLAEGNMARRVDVSGPTEFAKLGVAFNRMADSLEEAEELRRRLVADVSHELRNPIAAARAQAEGMAEGVLAVDPATLESLVDDMKHLSSLVDDLQELAVADAGRLRYEMVHVDLSALIDREVARSAAAAPEGVAVQSRGTSRRVMVCGDERRLSEVLRNLLSNALRHTVAGSVGVTLSVTPDGKAVVRVTDTGEGIPTKDLPYVFERFYRADTARATDTGGAGLGLAITRHIVEDHGGSVFAESEAGSGATVGFTLPEATGSCA
jgi:two-component system sensor histidine kinase BaeS